MRRELQRALAAAIEQGDIDSFQALIGQGACLSSACDVCESCGPLLYSLRWNVPEIARFVIKEGGSTMEVTCETHQFPGYTALHYNAYTGDIETLNAIIDREPALLFVRTAVHPVHVAILSMKSQVLESLLARASTAWDSLVSKSGLYLGQNAGKEALETRNVRNLYQTKYELTGPNLLDVPMIPSSSKFDWDLPFGRRSKRFPDGATPLHCAVSANNVDAVRLLLEAGASVDSLDTELFTPLHSAVCDGASKIAGILLDYGANSHSREAWGWPIWWYALANGDKALYQRLRGSDDAETTFDGMPRQPYMLLLSSNGMDMPFFNEHLYTLLCYNDGPPVAENFLLNCGRDLAVEVPIIDSVFIKKSWMASGKSSSLKRLLKRLGPESCLALLNKKSQNVDTPLYIVAASGRPEYAALLLKHGADPNVIGGRLGTPLMAAAKMGRTSVVKLLVDSGASVCYGYEGRWFSVLEQAKLFPEIVKWLLLDRWTRWRFLEWRPMVQG